MNSLPISIMPEQPGHDDTIEMLLDAAFGENRLAKTSYRLREGGAPVRGLSFLAWQGQDAGARVIGTIRFWAITIGGQPALLLGPLAVDPSCKGAGCGIALMQKGLEEARALGHRLVILVGDEPYYGRVGFARVPDGRIAMPGPQDPDRLLYLELVPGAFDGVSGEARAAGG